MVARGRQDVADEVLMLRFQRGDVSAFSLLVQRHQTPLFNYILRMVHSREVAEPLVQQALIDMVRGSPGFKHDGAFGSWAYGIARRICLPYSTKAQETSVISDNPQPGTDPILAALEALPTEQREVFLLKKIARLSFKDISGMTDTDEQTVKSRMRFVLDHLQAVLQSVEEDASS